ncbi:MAG TPA: sigma-54 dependent transcriptional regulator [Thermoanaerobaculaceae bacterium]|nr:sigma-54 dependent transcriptional regulator [Thermoanaerobaculaceae bacterium]
MMTMPVRILVVDDEQHIRNSLATWFREEGYDVSVAASGKDALAAVAREGTNILLVDIKMPGMDGLELQRKVRELAPDATIIIMTAYASVETAVQALKEGAYDYIVKPFDPEAVSRLVRKAAERYSLITENRALRERIAAASPALITSGSPAMARVIELVDQVAPTDTNVLITGESGTGKELVARLIHASSSRRFGAFVVENCGALAEGVLESELFGHERGAFTGAVGRHRGKIEMANEGTLFLDEIGDVPPKVQVDLLRVLQERTLRRVGGNETVKVDFRLVTATHRDLEAEVAADRFREDFYFRINVFQIELPPLRERPGDVPLLAEHFLQQFATQMNRRISGFTPDAMAALVAYPWPGNVRELANAIERAVVLCRGERIEASHFPFAGPPASANLSLSAVEEAHIRQILAACSYNVAQAARELDIDRVTLYNKMKKYGIERP